MRGRGWVGAAVMAGVAAVFAGLFFSCFEKTSFEIPTGYSREAQENPFLAAGRLLEAMGHGVVSLGGPAELVALPPPGATLVFTTRRRTLPAERSEALRAWVEAGGHLVVETWQLWSDEARRGDPLLDPLDLRSGQRGVSTGDPEADDAGAPEADDAGGSGDAGAPEADDAGGSGDAGVWVPREPARCASPEPGTGAGSEDEPAAEPEVAAAEDEPDEEPAEAEDEDEDEEVDVYEVASARFPGRDEPLRVRFHRRYHWLDDAGDDERIVFRIRGEEGDHLITLALGDGLLTALSDGEFLDNDSIGVEDHAEALLRLVRLRGRDGPVWIVTGERWPGLFEQLGRHARPLLASGAGLLALWLWRASRRAGPIRPLPDPARRRWMEHLEAVGRFHWRSDRGRALLEANRRELLRRLQRTHPRWAALPERARAARLAGICGLDPARVAEALGDAASDDEPESFVRSIRTLERIRDGL